MLSRLQAPLVSSCKCCWFDIRLSLLWDAVMFRLEWIVFKDIPREIWVSLDTLSLLGSVVSKNLGSSISAVFVHLWASGKTAYAPNIHCSRLQRHLHLWPWFDRVDTWSWLYSTNESVVYTPLITAFTNVYNTFEVCSLCRLWFQFGLHVDRCICDSNASLKQWRSSSGLVIA